MFTIVYIFLGKYVYWCVKSLGNIKATLNRANYSSMGCSATFIAQVVHTFGENKYCHNIEVGAETVYFIEKLRIAELVTFDMEGFRTPFPC